MGKKCEVETARSWNLEAFSDENEDFAMANSRAQGTQPRVKKNKGEVKLGTSWVDLAFNAASKFNLAFA